MMKKIPGIGVIPAEYRDDLISLKSGGNGFWKVGMSGVRAVLQPRDGKTEFIVFKDKTMAYVKSAMGYPAFYPLQEAEFTAPAEAVLMDLDGTSVRSESFWVWVIGQTTARLLGNPKFVLSPEDEPHVSGHSVSEHLQYCIRKYAPGKKVEEARQYYFEITRREMKEILEGRGRCEAFKPAPGLKEFLLAMKKHRVKIGLVTSGLYEKAWPEIMAVFRVMGLGNPLDFYDAIITAGYSIKKGQVGTLGELESKPHPWLYAETARVGLGIEASGRCRVIGLEDSGAGVISLRLAGFAVIGIGGGNIVKSGARPFLSGFCDSLLDSLPAILGRNRK